MRRRDAPCLHAAHGQAGHGAVWLVRESAKVGVDVGNQVLDDHFLERTEIERATSGRTRARWRRIGWPGTTDAAILHDDDEGLRFSLGDQVVHNQTGVALTAPACFIFAAAML